MHKQDDPLNENGSNHEDPPGKSGSPEEEELLGRFRERAKELAAMHRVSRVLPNSHRPIGLLREKLVRIFRKAWQLPRVTAILTWFNRETFSSPSFRPTRWLQTATLPRDRFGMHACNPMPVQIHQEVREMTSPCPNCPLPRAMVMVLVFLIVVSAPGWTIPTALNYLPTVDTAPDRNLVLQLSNYSFDFKRFDPVANPKPRGFKENSMIYSLQVGFKKAELGVDIIGDKDFSNTRSGNFAGPTAWNLKFRLMTEKPDPFSLAIGTYNLGATKYSGCDFYEPSPYIVAAKNFPGFRIHLGYQSNILGYRRLDSDRKRNDGILAGFDAVIIKHKKRPVSLFLDYFGGPAATFGAGLGQNITPRLGWFLSTFHPVKNRLTVSKWELPKQCWFAISYFMPF